MKPFRWWILPKCDKNERERTVDWGEFGRDTLGTTLLAQNGGRSGIDGSGSKWRRKGDNLIYSCFSFKRDIGHWFFAEAQIFYEQAIQEWTPPMFPHETIKKDFKSIKKSASTLLMSKSTLKPQILFSGLSLRVASQLRRWDLNLTYGWIKLPSVEPEMLCATCKFNCTTLRHILPSPAIDKIWRCNILP